MTGKKENRKKKNENLGKEECVRSREEKVELKSEKNNGGRKGG